MLFIMFSEIFLARGERTTIAGNAIDHAVSQALIHIEKENPGIPKLMSVTVPDTKHDMNAEIMS